MKKKKIKHKTTRRILTLDLCCAIFCSFILLTFTSYWVDIVNLYNEKKDLETNLTTLKEEEKNLKNDVKKLNDPDYVARYARERFFYSKNQEYIIRIP
ncbi:MAG: septum formation initiator family protein [Tenericutes bacterium]|jgi:cell division protein DivIC|nr:septum formation initiator family protein [Mycoplasmatota bacterium]